MEFGRRTASANDRGEEQRILKSLNVSSYLDDVYESLHTGAPPKVNVPNYKEPTRGEIYSEIASESTGLSMDFNALTHGMSEEQVKTAMGGAHPARADGERTFASSPAADDRPRFTVSRNQAMALKKYPTLIEFLGRPEGEKVAKKIASDMNVLMADLVSSNSKEANKYALVCKADKQNLRQYFQGDDWLCRVTASGPFRGDEAIFYSRDHDTACVMRRSEVDGQIKYENVSDQFNLIYEVEQGEIPATSVEKEAEASAEKATSAEGEIQDETLESIEISEAEEVAQPIAET